MTSCVLCQLPTNFYIIVYKEIEENSYFAHYAAFLAESFIKKMSHYFFGNHRLNIDL